jgi:DNA-binding transcriptional MerR regulator
LESCSDGNSIDDVLYYDDYTLPEPEQARSRAGYIKPSDRQLLKIQKLRDKGMTQKQIAKRLRMTPRQVQLLCDKIKERVSPLMLKSATAQASAAYDSQTLNSRKGEGLA